jgi:virginiamycin B lyase
MRTARALTAAAVLAWIAFASSPALAAPHFDGSFPVSVQDANNLKLAAGPDGNMWMTEPGGAAKNLAKIAPDGTVTEFELPAVVSPSGIAAGPDGNLWVTENGGVAKFSPKDPVGTEVKTPIAAIKGDSSIVAGPDGQMWVATTGAVVHFSPSNPAGAAAFEVEKLAPKDIDVAGSLLVIADSGNGRIVTMTTSGSPKDISMNGAEATSQGVAGSTGGQFAFSQQSQPEGLGLVTPPGPAMNLEMSGDPFGVALGSDGAYWFAMSADDNLKRLTPDGHVTPLNGFPPKFFPRQISAGPNNTLWVAMEIPGENTVEVARISGLEPPVKPGGGGGGGGTAPETTISKGPKGKVKTKHKRAKVKFTFGSTAAGATFECAMTRAKSKKGKKAGKSAAPKFSACKSPKTYQLKPGKYTFSVRAVSSAVTDPTPATRKFRVVHVGS